MGLKKLAAKVVNYNERLESGKASKIKPGHVEKVLGKASEEVGRTRGRDRVSALSGKAGSTGKEARRRPRTCGTRRMAAEGTQLGFRGLLIWNTA